jgi:hypothetical protein
VTTPQDETTGTTSRRPVKVTYLVIGLLFCGLAGIWLLGALDVVDSNTFDVWGPALLIVAGVVGLIANFANNQQSKRRRAVTSTAWQTDEETTTILEEEHHD